MKNIYEYLKSINISYDYFEHPPIFSSKDSHLLPKMPGVEIKNLFLHDKKNENYFLIVVPAHKRIDFKKLTNSLGAKKLSFGSSEKLKLYLGVEPGSVSILGLICDEKQCLSVFFDEELVGRSLQCHPLINTATLVIDSNSLKRFLAISGHSYQSIKLYNVKDNLSKPISSPT